MGMGISSGGGRGKYTQTDGDLPIALGMFGRKGVVADDGMGVVVADNGGVVVVVDDEGVADVADDARHDAQVAQATSCDDRLSERIQLGGGVGAMR